jgi:hypothetical protein
MLAIHHHGGMRIPLKGNDYFCQQVNAAFEKILEAYLDSIKLAITMQKAVAMLGDGTVTQTDTFDPQNVQTFYQRLTNNMNGWLASGISKSITDDLHRLFCQFNKDVGKIYISGYFGVQFHALPYYKADKRVIEIQKELAKIADDATVVFKDMTGKADKVLQAELESRGYASLDFQELFTKLFDDEKLAEELDKKAVSVESQFPEFERMRNQKTRLFAELGDLMIELYQTAHASLDYNRLMQGEEGVCTYFDIELIKNKKTNKREALFETKKITKEVADRTTSELLKVADAVKRAK